MKSPIKPEDFIKLSNNNDWDIDTVKEFDKIVEWINKDMYNLDLYPNQFEVVTTEQMLDAYSLVGLPLSYEHWKFGKDFSINENNYIRGQMGLSYELVINSDPCISYNMEENSTCLLLLVMIHAGIGHNAFFKNNYLFKQWTHADAIIDYMQFAKKYIKECEEKYGHEEVETLLDACHSLMNYGVSKYKKPYKLDIEKEERRIEDVDNDDLAASYHHLWSKTLFKKDLAKIKRDQKYKDDNKFSPEENILYFIEKNSPVLKVWQQEIVRIVRKVAQYFYPQSQCLVGSTYINTNGGFVKMEDIIKEEGYYESKIDILSIDNKFEKTSHFYKRKTDKTIKIKTKLGKTIEVTPEHPLMKINNDLSFNMVESSNLKIGNFLVNKIGFDNSFSDNNFQINMIFNKKNKYVICDMCGKKYQNLSTHIPTHNLTIKEYKLSHSENIISENLLYDRSGDVKIPKEMNKEIARLLGYFISEGSWIDHSFTISNQDMDIINDTQNLLETEFNINSSCVGNVTKTISVYNTKFFEILEYLGVGNVLSYFKEIPKSILQSKKGVCREFLSALFEGDGCNTEIGQIQYSTRSKILAEQVQMLLQQFGVVSKICEYEIKYDYKIDVPHKNNYKVIILGYFYNKFLNDIGFLSERKNKYTSNNNLSLNTFGIPYLNEKIIEIRNNIDLSTSKNKKLRRELLPNSRSIDSFKWDYVDSQLDKFEYIKEIDINNYNNIKNAINKENYYDEIISIEVLNEEKEVYDVTIPSNHLFITNGVVSHNTKVINEGVATYTHYNTINELHKRGFLSDKFMMEFYHHHSNVISQPEQQRFNPYTLGFNIISDVERIVKNPTKEDKEWFPNLIGQKWDDVYKEIIEGYKDDSFIQQFLSPKVIRDMRMFSIYDAEGSRKFLVDNIHNKKGYKQIRETLSKSYNRGNYVPEIDVIDVDWFGDRSITLKYINEENKRLSEESMKEVAEYIQNLWGFGVKLLDSNDKKICSV